MRFEGQICDSAIITQVPKQSVLPLVLGDRLLTKRLCHGPGIAVRQHFVHISNRIHSSGFPVYNRWSQVLFTNEMRDSGLWRRKNAREH